MMKMPPFLKNLTQSERQGFFEIIHGKNQTKAEIKANITSWAQNISSSLAAQVQAFQANFTAAVNQKISNTTSALNAAPAAFQQLATIVQNENITPEQEMQQIGALFQSLDPTVARILGAAIKSELFSGRGGPMGGGGRGGFGGGRGRNGSTTILPLGVGSSTASPLV